VYTEVGRFLAHYKSGKLPKVLKIVPSLSNWEEILFLTNPETWTPHATYAATRIFASNFNPAKAQRFFNLVLLPKCRDDIFSNKRLNFHYYLALKKATYKPAAFYKGILLPLGASGDCTLKEAIIFGSILNKASIPQLHSAAAIVKLAMMKYNGAISIFLKLLINKKYTLPYMAIDLLVKHFTDFISVKGPMPIIWFQSCLAFVQRYKADITKQQKEEIRNLLSSHSHHILSNEIKRELFSVPARGEPLSLPSGSHSNF
jgi:essential nuclear protein 1